MGSRHLQLSHYATLLAYQVLSTLGIRKSDLLPMVFTGKREFYISLETPYMYLETSHLVEAVIITDLI